tara:strand:+ start:779 stop:931 length:153 start_codon:yes stop_codon:yes gene_type:complete
MYKKAEYKKYVEWCKEKDLEPLSEEEEKKYGIWNSIVHLGWTEDTTCEPI